GPTANPGVTGEATSADLAIIDEKFNWYEFHLDQAAVDKTGEDTPPPGLTFTLRIPLYYTRSSVLGFQWTSKGLPVHAIAGDRISGSAIGAYLGYTLGPIRPLVFIGASSYSHSGDIGVVEAAGPDDPGLLWRRVVYPPGTPLRFQGRSDSTLAWGAAIQIRLLPAAYLEASYEHWGPAQTGNYTYRLGYDSQSLPVDDPAAFPKPLSFTEHTFWKIAIGIGY
ncbi:MAG TPA: hypothetical protein VF234_09085, partial [Limnochordia bacterium]